MSANNHNTDTDTTMNDELIRQQGQLIGEIYDIEEWINQLTEEEE